VWLGSAPEGHQAGNASLLRAHGALWVVWENATQDKSESRLVLLHTEDDPFDDPWQMAVVQETAGQIKPSVATGADGVYVLTNHCGGDCEDVDFNRAQVDLHLATAPLQSSARWDLPVDPEHDAGRGDVAVGASGDLVACISDTDPASDLETLRCDALAEDTWRPLMALESGDTADHPSVLLDGNERSVVGFDGKVDGVREAHLRFDDGTRLRLSPGHAGGDVQVALSGDRLHAVWRSRSEAWVVHHGVCDAYPDCGALERWVVTDLEEAPFLDGLGIDLDGSDPVVVWSRGPTRERTDVRAAWIRSGQPHFSTIAEGASTNQGQPCGQVVDGALWVVYTVLPTDEAPAELRLSRVPGPSR
jgi:hypothetical protein